MSDGLRKGLLLAAIQVGIVLSLGGKLLYDRATRPRVWVLAGFFDPDLPIRGRYVSEQLEMPAEGLTYREQQRSLAFPWSFDVGYIQLRDGQLVATHQGSGPRLFFRVQMRDGKMIAQLQEPVLFFVPEHASVPQVKPGEQMWVEVTLPAKGPPRPLRIGIKKDGVLTPLNLE